MVMPGLIDLHSHPSTEPFYRGVREEHGVPAMYMSGLYERSFALQPDAAARRAGKQVAFCEMLLSGITSVADLSGIDEGWIDTAAQSGLRVFLAPSYASARWHLENGWALKYRWDEAAGRRGFDAALALIEQAALHSSGRLSGIVSPAQIDTCTTDLLRDSFAAAEARDLPMTVHCAQSVNEFLVMVDRHGKSPVQFARDLGILSTRTVLGHAMFIDEHSWVRWHTRTDLRALAYPHRSARARRHRHACSALPITVRALRPHAGGLRSLHQSGRQSWHRHRRRPAQRDRGNASRGHSRKSCCPRYHHY
jgi:cytosine/adenosine deaminase-related metal-dependent hydrolase